MIRFREIITGRSALLAAARRRFRKTGCGLSRLRLIAITVGLLATITSTLSVYPHQLAYFNEVSGGPENGYKHLLHSNGDWGQDLLFVREWLVAHQIPTDAVTLGQHPSSVYARIARSNNGSEQPDYLLTIVGANAFCRNPQNGVCSSPPAQIVSHVTFSTWAVQSRL